MSRSLWAILACVACVLPGSAAERGAMAFSFGKAQGPAAHIRVAADAGYQADTGFGFEAGSMPVEEARCVTSDRPFVFSVKLAEGNYRVRLTLGGGPVESHTTVKAEARRLMLEDVRTTRGETVVREIMMNVRTPRISDEARVKLKQREKDQETFTWDDKLTLEFNGVRPSLQGLEIRAEPTAPTLFLAGDSTVCDQPNEPWNSWGQMLPRFIKPGLAVANYAQSGETIRSSLGAGRFDKVFAGMKPGDLLLMQFGHNDMKDRAPDALERYREQLRQLVARTREKGGTPVLVTSMERKAGVKAPTLGAYPETVREVARGEKVALIDLNAMSLVLYRALGDRLDLAFQDGSHHNNYGSYELAKCVATGLVATRVKDSLTDEAKAFDPAHPDDPDSFTVPASPSFSRVKPEGN